MMTARPLRKSCLSFPGWLALLSAIAWVALATAPDSVRGDDPSRPESLSVFILVDVSRSMYITTAQRDQFNLDINPFVREAHGSPGGSDPERQRWDAVKLLLDLLTADDRATILPFNQFAPASSGNQWVPGPVTEALQSPRFDRDRLERMVEEFAHNRDHPPGLPNFIDPNRDLGGTGIFIALQEAHRRASEESVEVGRRQVILLLTDGDDSELVKKQGGKERRDLVDRNDEALKTEVRGPTALRQSIPIYTMGLGGDVKDELLVRIAKVTGGSYRRIGPATALVPTFRDLIWSLKYCWIKSPVAEVRKSRELLEGILDLGVLSYRSQATGHAFTREARQPSPSSTISDVDFGQFAGQRRSGNQGRDYLYEYFGPLKLTPGKIDADWSTDPPGDRRAVSFSKRTARRLFNLSEPAEGVEVDRLEKLRITATFNETEPFLRDHFRLWYSLRPAGDDPRPDSLLSMDENFHAEADLPRPARGSSPRYTLRVEAEGIGDHDKRPLAGYRLILPEKTIQVREALRLVADPPTLKLTGSSREASVKIKGRDNRTLGGEIKLSYRFEPPVKKDAKKGSAPLSTRAISVTPRLGSVESREVVIQNGSGAIDLALGSGSDQPELGAEYDPGTLIVSGGSDLGVALTELRIPVQIQLRPASLAIVAPGPIRVAAGGINPLAPQRLKVVDDGGLGSKDLKVVVTLKKARGAEFSTDELWIEPAEDPVPRSARSRSLSLPLGREFQVRFEPTSNNGQHEYELDARLTGKDERQAVPARASVSVEYEYPTLSLVSPTVTVRVPRGGSQKVTVKAFVKGPAGLQRPVVFRPEDSSRDERYVEVVPRSEPMMVATTETPVELELKAAADAPYRSYAIKGMIADLKGGSKETPLTIVALVDELRIADRTAQLIDIRKPIPVELWMGSSHTRQLELSTAIEGSLPGAIRIAPGVENANATTSQSSSPGISAEVDHREDGGAFLLPRRATLKLTSGELSGRILSIEFPKVLNVEPNRPYRVYLDLVPDRDTALAPRVLLFEVRYRRIDDLQPQVSP
jgi:hypothetical protein